MSLSSPCPDADRLRLLVLGQLPAAEAERWERHVTACDTCAQALGDLDATDRLVADLRQAPRVAAAVRRGPVVDDLCRRLRSLRVPVGTGVAQAGHDFLGPAQAPDEIGRLGNYAVLRLLGTGGMGVVFLARHARLRRLVAVKMILAGGRPDAERVARFHREAAAVARLQHANIVQLYEYGEQEGRPFFAMEHVDGGSLAGQLGLGAQAPRAAAALVETLARAAHYAHGQGVVHRDLKPANILLARGEGRGARGEGKTDSPSPLAPRPSPLVPKISDFGLARLVGDDGLSSPGCATQSDVILGTPAYMAPEQATGRSQDSGPAADVYALGAILYEALTGRPPFRGEAVLDTLEQVRTQDPVPPRRLRPVVPRDVETICLKCLAKEPARRYASAAALADDLAAFLDGRPIQARPVGLVEGLVKWARRRPALAVLLGLGFLLPVVAAAALAFHSARLGQALAEKTAQEAKVRHEKERADANYRQARETINAMLLRTHDRASLEVPQLLELRRQQAEDALRFFRAVVSQQAESDPVVRHELARAIVQLAQGNIDIGRRDDGMTNYREALAVFDELVAADPANRDARYQQGYCHSQVGYALLWQRPQEAEPSLQQAIDLLEGLEREGPGNATVLQRLGLSYHNYGMLCRRGGRLPEAETHYRQAIERYTAMPAAPTEQVRNALADSWTGVGLVCWQTKRFADAATAYRQAEEQLTAIRRDSPHNLDAAATLGALCINWGLLLQDEMKGEEALARLGQAVAVLEAAHKQEPKFQRLPPALHNAHGARATLLEKIGRPREAASHWERQVEFASPNDKPRYLRLLARKCAQLGDAGATLAVLQRLHDLDRNLWPKHAAEIAVDPGFAPLRDREEFKRLLGR